MPLEVCTIGGFSEVGRNCTAIKVDDEVIILDMGLQMERYIRYTDDIDIAEVTYQDLLEQEAVPDYGHIEDWKDKVKAIVPSHGHLDHIGAIPFAAHFFGRAPIICTPYTAEVIRSICRDKHVQKPYKIMAIPSNTRYRVSDKVEIELVHITHSIPDCAVVVIHTPYGRVVYANDYKLDMTPTLGAKPNLKRLRAIGQEGVKLLIMEALYAHEHKKTPSEAVARSMLREVVLGVDIKDKGLILTTFSSHIARLKSIVELGKKLNRKIVFCGRSLHKYVKAAEKIGIIDFGRDVEIAARREQMERVMNKIMKQGKEKYMLVVTGHQGEPKAVLSRMAHHQLPWQFDKGDVLVYSCQIIPAELNQDNRGKLDKELKAKGVRLFSDVHVSGHASREDDREMIEMLKPENLIPSHVASDKAAHLLELAREMGFDEKQIHQMADGKRLHFS